MNDKDEISFDTNLFNIFLRFYQYTFKEHNKSMLDDIDDEEKESTNRQMEMFYDECLKYKYQSSREDLITINKPYTVNLDEYDEMYCLKIDNKEKAICPSLLALLSCISEKIENWEKKNWVVFKIK